MLLLVVQTQFNHGLESSPAIAAQIRDQLNHLLVHFLSILERLRHRRPRDQATTRTAVHRADGIVIGIEQISISGGQFPLFARGPLQNKRIKEPTGVRQVPFGRARIGHGLDDVVFGLQRLAERLGEGADFAVQLNPL